MAMGIFAVDDMAGLDVGLARAAGARPLRGARRAAAARARPAGRDGPARAEDAARAGIATATTASRRRIRKSMALIRVASPTRPASRRGDLATRRSSSARSTRWSTKARARSRTAWRCAPSDIDVIYVNGYGFPAWRGGPMFYADRVGLAHVLERIAAFHREHGERWRAGAAARASSRESGRTFRECDRSAEPLSVSSTFEARRANAARCCRPDVGRRRRDARRPAARRDRRMPLGPYPARLTDRLEHWADRAPDRTFLAARDAAGAWQRADVRGRRSIARASCRAGAARPAAVGRAADRDPVRQQHRARAAGARRDARRRAVRADRAVVLAAARRTTARCGRSCDRMQPGLVFAAEGAALRARARQPSLPPDVELVTSYARPGRSTRDAVRRAARDHAATARSTTRTRASGPTRSRRCCSRRARRAARRA